MKELSMWYLEEGHAEGELGAERTLEAG